MSRAPSASWQFGGLRRVQDRPPPVFAVSTYRLHHVRSNTSKDAGKVCRSQTRQGACRRCCASPTLSRLAAVSAVRDAPRTRPPGARDSEGRLLLKSLTRPQLEEWCTANGEDLKRAEQLWRWMYHEEGQWVSSMEATAGLQNGLSRAFREKFGGTASLSGGLQLQRVHTAADGTRKLLSTLSDDPTGTMQVETVMIPIVRRQGMRQRITICVSSQIGCAMNCQFCYTGRMGLKRDLNAAQIVEQVIIAKRLLAADMSASGSVDAKKAAHITNVVFMGMGEPLANLGAVLPAVDNMCQTTGLQLSHKKVTVSTVGLVPEMLHFMRSSRAQLAVSLHATTDAVRDWLCPVNRRWNLATLLGALQREYPRSLEAAGSRSFVLIEYVMLRDINDTAADAHRMVELLKPIHCKVNLIVFNTHAGSRFQPSTAAAVEQFRSVLIQSGYICTVRDSRGDEEMAACGQLGAPIEGTAMAQLLQPPEKLLASLLPEQCNTGG